MSGSGNSPIRTFEGNHKLDPISLPLHEALGLVLLFQAATAEQVQSLQMGGAYYGYSAAHAYLRIRREIARLFGDEQGLETIAVEVAMLDQAQEGWSS